MDRESILETILTVVAEKLEVEYDSLTDETTFEELEADSFDMLELITAREEVFEKTLDDEALASIVSIGDAVDAVAAALED